MDREALKAHGYVFESDSDTDSGKSEFDEEYYKNKPPPLAIDHSRLITIRPPNTELNLQHSLPHLTDNIGVNLETTYYGVNNGMEVCSNYGPNQLEDNYYYAGSNHTQNFYNNGNGPDHLEGRYYYPGSSQMQNFYNNVPNRGPNQLDVKTENSYYYTGSDQKHHLYNNGPAYSFNLHKDGVNDTYNYFMKHGMCNYENVNSMELDLSENSSHRAALGNSNNSVNMETIAQTSENQEPTHQNLENNVDFPPNCGAYRSIYVKYNTRVLWLSYDWLLSLKYTCE